MPKSAATPAITALQKKSIAHHVHTFNSGSDHFGEHAAAALEKEGITPERIFKTLVIQLHAKGSGSDSLAVACVPVTGSLNLKKAAAALGAAKASMADQHRAAAVTGYVPGGISPVGQKKRLPTVIHRAAMDHDTIFVSGGRRGLDVELAPADLVAITQAEVADIAAP